MRFLLFLALLTVLPLRASAADFAAVTGSWAGWYNCAQGATALELDISASAPQYVQALFYFHGLPQHALAPAGCFLMQGTISAATGKLQLQPEQWLMRPLGYVPVALSGQLDGQGRLSGQIFGPGCSNFLLARQLAPQAPARCKPPLGLGSS